MSDRIVCDCVGTTVEDIKTAVANGAKTVEDIKQKLKKFIRREKKQLNVYLPMQKKNMV